MAFMRRRISSRRLSLTFLVIISYLFDSADAFAGGSSSNRSALKLALRKQSLRRLETPSPSNNKLSTGEDDLSWEDIVLPPHADETESASLSATTTTTDSTVLHTSLQQQPATEHHLTTAEKRKFTLATIIILLLWRQLLVAHPGSYRFYLAGGLCAAASHTIPVPIDVVKTRKQVDPALANASFMDATRTIVQNEGLHSLLAGLGPTSVGYFIEGAVKFGVYEVLKPMVGKLLLKLSQSTSLVFLNSQVVSFVVCGTAAGLAAALVLCPMEGLRIRMVAEPDFAPHGWIQGASRMVKMEGTRALSKGLLAMILKQVPYTVCKNVSFDLIAKGAYATLVRNGIGLTHTVKFTVPLVAAASASILACVSSQPGDMLLSLVNAHRGSRRTLTILHDILRSKKGVAGLFVGINERFLHVGMIVTLQLLLYDFIKRLCGIAATGLA